MRKSEYKSVRHQLRPPVRRWLILDGPVDTLWIESMNTVLDDNKMMCLMNGDIISMPEEVSVLFEVSDLAKASLATVSRCRMLYMQDETIHWSSLLQSWLKGLGDTFAPNMLKRLDLLFDAFVTQCYSFMQKRCVQYIKLIRTILSHIGSSTAGTRSASST